MRFATTTLAFLFLLPHAVSAEWVPLTAELVEKERPGYGGLSGVVVDPANGHLFVNLSDRGVYRSTDRGNTWERLGAAFKGRTETPGCFQIDPTGKTKRLLLPTVYGSPVLLGSAESGDWKPLDKASMHVDWCGFDWTAKDPRFLAAFKHEAGGLLLVSRDGGTTFTNAGKGFGFGWVFDADTAVVSLAKSKDRPKGGIGPKEASFGRPTAASPLHRSPSISRTACRARPKGGIVRTTDGGKSFAPVAEHFANCLPRWRNGVLYWLAEGSLLKSADKGATWGKAGAVKDGRYGPVFGKSDKHLLALTGAGVIESTDGGAAWSAPLAPPKELKGVSSLTWLEYDPTADVIYLMKMGSQLYAWKKGSR